jgi:hypothetical protein
MSHAFVRPALQIVAVASAACALNGAPAVQPNRSPAAVTRVEPNRPWTETPLAVHKGDQLFFTATGEIRWAATGLISAPDGIDGAIGWHVGRGGLVGRVGTAGRPFDIGSRTAPFPDKHPRPPHTAHPPPPITMSGDGRLFLGFDHFTAGDNQGSYEVTITTAAR